MNIGAIIKRERERLGMTQADLADAVGVRQGFISKLENGSRVPSAARLPAYAEALRIDVNTLYEEDVTRQENSGAHNAA